MAMPALCSAAAIASVLMPVSVCAHDHVHGSTSRVQYVANQGQWPASVRFKAAFPASAMFLQDDGVTWVRMQDDAPELVHEYIQWDAARQATFALQGHAWKMRFIDADASALKHGEQRRSEVHNYFLGDDPARWASNVPVYEGTRYEGLWPGIDLRWHSEDGHVKYDLLLAPGADARRIAFRYEGLDGLGIDQEGNLVLATSVGALTEMKPVAWYADDRTPLPCAFDLKNGEVRFRFPEGIDAARGVVIDPMLMGATYSGQVGASNYGHCSTYDAAGHIYGGAQNFGFGFPASLGAFQTTPGGGFGTDIVVNKFSPDATALIWATYIGGSSDDKPHSMIVNSAEELCILGSTTGVGFPTTSGAFDATHNGGSDIVIVHLNSTATALIGSTYLGGSQEDGRQSMTNNYGDTFRGEVMVDPVGNIFIASSSQSSNFPVTAGAFQATLGGGQDAVVVGVDPTCSNLLLSTYLGGSSNDNGLGLRFDGQGGLYVCGGTASSNFPMVPGGYQGSYQGGGKDAYVVRLTVAGDAMMAGTFFGTSSDDMAYFIDLDNDNDVYIYGQSPGTIPIQPAGIYGQPGGGIFLAAFDPSLATTVFTTKVGASMAPVAFLVDMCERIYVSGYNPNGTWEVTPDALYGPGFSQFYLACYDVDMGGLLFGTYYGGSHVDGGTSRFDKAGIIYQGVCSGGQSMPTTPGSYAPTNNVGWDLGVFKIDFQQSGVFANVSATAVTGCAPSPITFTANGNAPYYIWHLGDGTIVDGTATVSHTYAESGVYTVMLVGIDSLSCNVADTAYVVVTISDPSELLASFTAEPLSSCDAYGVQLNSTSTGGGNLLWDLGGGNQSNQPNPLVNVGAPGSYEFVLLVIDPICQDTAMASLTVVVPPASMTIDLPSPAYICPGDAALLSAGPGYDSYLWSTSATSMTINVEVAGVYTVTVTDGFCTASDAIDVLDAPVHEPMLDRATCPGIAVQLAPTFNPQSITWSTGEQQPSISVSGSGLYWFAATDAYGCAVEDTVRVDVLQVSGGEALVPNVFSPNGDGVNDVFEVDAPTASDFSMEVFNRWGQLMYRTRTPWLGWKGSVDNEPDQNVPDGTYFFIVRYTDLCAKDPEVSKAGHVTLLR